MCDLQQNPWNLELINVENINVVFLTRKVLNSTRNARMSLFCDMRASVFYLFLLFWFFHIVQIFFLLPNKFWWKERKSSEPRYDVHSNCNILRIRFHHFDSSSLFKVFEKQGKIIVRNGPNLKKFSILLSPSIRSSRSCNNISRRSFISPFPL